MRNPLNAQLNPSCHFLALLGPHLIFHVSWLRVNSVSNTVITEFSKRNVSYRNICSHTNTVFTTHRCTLMDYFNNCTFSKHKLMRSLMMV